MVVFDFVTLTLWVVIHVDLVHGGVDFVTLTLWDVIHVDLVRGHVDFVILTMWVWCMLTWYMVVLTLWHWPCELWYMLTWCTVMLTWYLSYMLTWCRVVLTVWTVIYMLTWCMLVLTLSSPPPGDTGAKADWLIWERHWCWHPGPGCLHQAVHGRGTGGSVLSATHLQGWWGGGQAWGVCTVCSLHVEDTDGGHCNLQLFVFGEHGEGGADQAVCGVLTGANLHTSDSYCLSPKGVVYELSLENVGWGWGQYRLQVGCFLKDIGDGGGGGGAV